MRRPPTILLAALAVGGLVGVSCGGDDDAGPTRTAPAEQGAAGSITVFAAASLTDAFEEVGTAFTAANPDASVTFSFAGSSDLVAQILQGAPADVFASADQRTMDALTDAGGAAGEPAVFATNRLEIITAPGNPEGITGPADLADPDLLVVTCAPEVPCGAYSEQLLDAAGVTVTPVSFEQSVKGVAAKVVLGEADAGIVYATDVLAAGDAATGVEIPSAGDVVAEYPIATTTDAGEPETARAFVDFVIGPDAQAVLARFGFSGP